MQTPLEIAFRRCEPSEELRSEIVTQARRLEKFSRRITSCKVAIVGPGNRHKHGGVFSVEIRIAMPEHKEIVIDKTRAKSHEREHGAVAIREAFAAAQRRIEDVMRGMRGQVKTHLPEDRGRLE